MATVEALKDRKDIELMKAVLKERNLRNYLLFIIGCNTGLRIGDILSLRVSDFMNSEKVAEYLQVREEKTGKERRIAINASIQKALKLFVGKQDMRVLTVEEQRKLLVAVQADRLCAAFMLDLATGLRLGELLGLRWQDVDLDNGVLSVKRSITRVKNFDDKVKTKTVLIVQEPKSKSGRRSVPIPDNVVKTLKLYKTRQKVERLAAGKATGIMTLYSVQRLEPQ